MHGWRRRGGRDQEETYQPVRRWEMRKMRFHELGIVYLGTNGVYEVVRGADRTSSMTGALMSSSRTGFNSTSPLSSF